MAILAIFPSKTRFYLCDFSGVKTDLTVRTIPVIEVTTDDNTVPTKPPLMSKPSVSIGYETMATDSDLLLSEVSLNDLQVIWRADHG